MKPTGTDIDLLADLTPAQQEAVMHIDGPLLILAGAGSGKTRVITRRVAYLLQQGVPPRSILAVTFTNKAAGEMRDRIARLLPQSTRDESGVELPPHRFLRISTFHSFGVYFLRRYANELGIDKHFTIYDQTDRGRLVKAAIDEMQVDSFRFTPERVESAISKAKNQLIGPEKYLATANDFFTQTVARIYPVYEKKLRTANAVDFDDLIYWPALALKHNQELRAQLDAHFRYVMIDEYQDTNLAQYQIARQLSVDYPNLCVVGDPDQSIYKWRGSDIRNILDFEDDFPNARVITLDRNYRSTRAILHAASKLIAHNRQRKPKDLVTENEQGQPVAVLAFATSEDEADGLARRITEAVKQGKRRYRDVAVFMRVNALSRALETAFLKQGVPYQIVRGLAFFDRKENRDVLAYLKLLLNPRDDLSFQRIVNEPTRGVGKTSLEHLQNYAAPRELSLLSAATQVEHIPAIKGKATTGLRDFVVLMNELRQVLETPAPDVIRAVLDKSGYQRMLQDSTDPRDVERLANVEEIITAAKQFTDEDDSRTIADFLESVTLASDVDSWDEKQDCVSIMTLHAAKGLEFPVVYMLAVEHGLLPHERSLEKPEDIEEERRLAFVGMTRAKQELYLTIARQREFRGRTLYTVPSMFLDELPADALQTLDLAGQSPYAPRGADRWRGGSEAADEGWEDAGVRPKPRAQVKPGISEPPLPDETNPGLVEGAIVSHDTYGAGRVTQVSGYGAMRKVKIRFSAHGERTFFVAKAKLTILSMK
jgi:DNA helicase-2/ATP-dependent DNA helicase PcrA